MQNPSAPESEEPNTWVPHVIEKASSLRFGSIQIKIHEGQVIVVESTEQRRFHLPKAGHIGQKNPRETKAKTQRP